jgi:hypothetical protein
VHRRIASALRRPFWEIAMAIRLQDTVDAFDAGFLLALPRLEQAMIDAGIDPSEVVIAKQRAAPGDVPERGAYHYTVSAGAQRFTVAESDDSCLLDHLCRCIVAAAPAEGGALN